MNYRRRINQARRRRKTIQISQGARQLLEQYGLDTIPPDLQGSGKHGNIIKRDVVAWLASSNEEEE